MLDFHMANVANAPHEFETACGMDPEPDAQIGQAHTMQTIGQDGRPITAPKTNLAKRMREFIETETPPLVDQRDQSPRHTRRPIGYPTSSPTHPALHGVNQGYSTRTQAQHGKITNDNTRQHSYSPPGNYASPYGSVPRTLPEPNYMSPGNNTIRRHSYQDQTRTPPNDNAGQRHLRQVAPTKGTENARKTETRNDNPPIPEMYTGKERQLQQKKPPHGERTPFLCECIRYHMTPTKFLEFISSR